MLELRTEERFPTDEHLGEGWEALAAGDPAASIFQTGRFLRRWCRHLRRDCDLRLRFAFEGGELVGVVPEVRERGPDGQRQVVRFAGGHHVTDYLGPVARPDRRGAVVDAWFGALEDEDDWGRLVAGGLPGDAGWHDLIAARAASSGWTVDGPTGEDVCPRIDLRGGWDRYLDGLTGKQRHELRRKARKLSRESGVAKLVHVDVDDLHDAVDAFVASARTAGGAKGRFFDDAAMAHFYHALATEFGPDRRMRVHRLEVDGAHAASAVSLLWDRTWGLYNSAFDPELGDLAPGMVLVGEMIRIAAEESHDVFDLLRGDESYKYRFGSQDRPVCGVEVVRGGP